jgi:Ca2+/H+ antiporter, TMEM165/GDT1 family
VDDPASPRHARRVDIKLFLSTFVAIFVAEMGDKTQLATLSAASGETSRKWVVFAASALALVATSAVAVGAADVVGRFVSPAWLKRAAGVLFIVLGVLSLREGFARGEPEPPRGAERS